MYGEGQGVPQDYAEAARWYHKAADQGDPYLQSEVAERYEEGRGVPQDYAEAARWYRKAADQGDPYAQFRLGLICKQGLGVPQDYVTAHMWFNVAAATAKTWPWHRDFSKELDAIAAEMNPQQISEAQRLAREWTPSGAE